MVYLIQGFTLGFSAGATPGPLHAYLSSQTLKNGWRRALPAVFAPIFSDGPIIALVLLVLTQLPDSVLRGLQVAGGLFILLLAREAYRDFKTAHDDSHLEDGTARDSLQKAVIVNLLNPNPYIFWGVVGGPLLLEGWDQAASYGIGFLVAFYAGLIGTFAGFVALLTSARHLGPRVSQILSGLSAVALFGFGVYQLYLGLAG